MVNCCEACIDTEHAPVPPCPLDGSAVAGRAGHPWPAAASLCSQPPSANRYHLAALPRWVGRRLPTPPFEPACRSHRRLASSMITHVRPRTDVMAITSLPLPPPEPLGLPPATNLLRSRSPLPMPARGSAAPSSQHASLPADPHAASAAPASQPFTMPADPPAGPCPHVTLPTCPLRLRRFASQPFTMPADPPALSFAQRAYASFAAFWNSRRISLWSEFLRSVRWMSRT